MSIRTLLLGNISAAALMSDFASRIPDTRSYGQRPTPRKPERRKRFPVASPHRHRQRLLAKFAYRKQLRKEREIGVDPIYANGLVDRHAASAEWRKRSRAWDAENSRKVV